MQKRLATLVCCMAASVASIALGDIAFITSNTQNVIYKYDIPWVGEPVLLETITHSTLNSSAFLTMRQNGALVVSNRSACQCQGSLTNLAATSCGVLSGQGAGSVVESQRFFFGVEMVGDHVYVADAGSARIRRFSFNAAGTPVFEAIAANTPGNGRGLTVNPFTREVYLSFASGPVHRYTINDDMTLALNGSISNGINNPHGMIVAWNGDFFVVNEASNNVTRYRFDTSGVPQLIETLSGNGLDHPIGVGISPWRELLVVSQGASRRVSRWKLDTGGAAQANGNFQTPTPCDDIVYVDAMPAGFVTPAQSQVCPGATAEFSVMGAGGAGFTYRWQTRVGTSGLWCNVTNGVGGSCYSAGTFSGATTSTLTISNVTADMSAWYRAIVEADCGLMISAASKLTVCPPDFDCDGFISGADFDSFVTAFEEGDLRADFDGDGFITGLDYDLYVQSFEGGC